MDYRVHYQLLERFKIQTRHLSPIQEWLRFAPSLDALKHRDIDLEGIKLLIKHSTRRFTLRDLYQKPYLSWEDILTIKHEYDSRVELKITLEDFCSHPYTPVSFLEKKGIFHPKVTRNPTLTLEYFKKFEDRDWKDAHLHNNPGITIPMIQYMYPIVGWGTISNPVLDFNAILQIFGPLSDMTDIEDLVRNPSVRLSDLDSISETIGELIYQSPNITEERLDPIGHITITISLTSQPLLCL